MDENSEKKEKLTSSQFYLNNSEELYINLIDLINKKGEKLDNLKKNSNIYKIIENNTLNSLLNKFDMLTEKNKFNNKKEKEELKDIIISLYAESKIKKIICSILWIINNFKEYYKFSLTPFYDFIKNIYRAFEKKTITISILIDCINFLKSKSIIDENLIIINRDLFIDFLILIESQIKLKDNAIIFCLQKTENEIEDVINVLKGSDINFLNLNDINDFKACYNFIKEIFTEKIANDIMLFQILRNKFNKDISIYIKFKNFFKYYKNIILLYKESKSTVNTAFQNAIDNFLEDSQLTIKCDEFYNIISELKILKDNNIKTFDEIYEIKEMVFINYNNDKQKIIKFQKFFDAINNIKKLIESINYLYQIGYPYLREFKLNIENGNILCLKDNKLIDISELINEINNLNVSFKKKQIHYFEHNPILTFINGKLYPFLLNNDLLSEKNIILNKERKNIIRYISCNMIQKELNNFEFSKEKINNCDLDYFFKLLINYIQLTFEENNISLEKVIKTNFIVDEFNYIKGGIFFIEYKKENLEYNILNIYQEITGNYPINNTLLICNKDTTFEKIYSFLFSFFLCEYPVLFLLINIEILDLSLKNKIILLIRNLNKIYIKRRSSLIILGQQDSLENNYEINLKRKINEISENKIILLDK